MDALTSLDRDVVWRFEAPTRAQMDRFRARIVADLSRGLPIPPVLSVACTARRSPPGQSRGSRVWWPLRASTQQP